MYKRITASERSYTRNVLIRSASRNGGEKMSAELDGQYKRLRRLLATAWRTKDGGTAFSRFVLQTPRMPFVACNELAIATKSIASVCPHAERTPWVPFQGGTAVWAALSNTSGECVVAKANEADCFANAEVQTREEGGKLHLILD